MRIKSRCRQVTLDPSWYVVRGTDECAFCLVYMYTIDLGGCAQLSLKASTECTNSMYDHRKMKYHLRMRVNAMRDQQ